MSQIKYRKNDDWNILSFTLSDLDNMYYFINKNLKALCHKDDIDIIDVNINSYKDKYGEPTHYITVFYALVRSKSISER